MTPLIGIVMGSDSDFATMRAAAETCQRFGVAYEVRVVSAHRTPDDMAEYGRTAQSPAAVYKRQASPASEPRRLPPQ